MRVAIVGAGFSGIGMGATLQRTGHEYAIFERAGDLGGVWQHNTYPGACCDVPSAQWDHAHDLTGERVAVVGTGASAVQLIPEVAQRAAHLDVYQRSAPYLLPRRNRAYTDPVRQLLRRIPGAQRLRRYGMCGVMESITFGLTRSSVARALLRAWSASFMRIQLRGDRGLRRRARPDYPFGCKRILFSSSYLPALRRDDVEPVSDQIDRITARSVVTRDGTERAVDTIIWGTGFQTNEFVVPMRVFGSGGAELQHSWCDGAEAHRGISVAGYPNMFLLYGPNTNLGAGSIIVMLEAQIRYVSRALSLISDGRAIDVRPDTQRRYADDVQRRLHDTVWTGCDSWYRRGDGGRIVTNWPGFVAEYLRDTREVDAGDYAVLRAPTPNDS